MCTIVFSMHPCSYTHGTHAWLLESAPLHAHMVVCSCSLSGSPVCSFYISFPIPSQFSVLINHLKLLLKVRRTHSAPFSPVTLSSEAPFPPPPMPTPPPSTHLSWGGSLAVPLGPWSLGEWEILSPEDTDNIRRHFW